MALKALASTDPLPAAATILSNLSHAVSRLRLLCTTRLQRRLHRSLGSHESVVNAIRVLDEVENGFGTNTPPAVVDGIFRLPPDELTNAREECFAFLAAFCGGGTAAEPPLVAGADVDDLAQTGVEGGVGEGGAHRIDRSYSNRRNTFGGSPRAARADAT